MRLFGILLAVPGLLLAGPTEAAPTRRPRLTGDASGVRVERGRRSARRRAPRYVRRALRTRRGRMPTSRYAGVRPNARVLPRGPRLPSGACWLTWPGFQLTPRGSRVFLQFTERREPEIRTRGRTLELFFPNCRVYRRNNARTLVTRYFATPVLSVRARNRRKGVLVTIRLRRAAHPTTGWRQIKGLAFYNLEFSK